MVKLDADHAGELIAECERIKKAWGEHPHDFFDGMSLTEIGHRYFCMGSLVQRIESLELSYDDYDLLESWLAEYSDVLLVSEHKITLVLSNSYMFMRIPVKVTDLGLVNLQELLKADEYSWYLDGIEEKEDK